LLFLLLRMQAQRIDAVRIDAGEQATIAVTSSAPSER
jgi:hypothetical protein